MQFLEARESGLSLYRLSLVTYRWGITGTRNAGIASRDQEKWVVNIG